MLEDKRVAQDVDIELLVAEGVLGVDRLARRRAAEGFGDLLDCCQQREDDSSQASVICRGEQSDRFGLVCLLCLVRLPVCLGREKEAAKKNTQRRTPEGIGLEAEGLHGGGYHGGHGPERSQANGQR